MNNRTKVILTCDLFFENQVFENDCWFFLKTTNPLKTTLHPGVGPVGPAPGTAHPPGSGREHFCALTREIHREIARESKTHGFGDVLEGIWSFSAKLFRVLGNRSRSSRPLPMREPESVCTLEVRKGIYAFPTSKMMHFGILIAI